MSRAVIVGPLNINSFDGVSLEKLLQDIGIKLGINDQLYNSDKKNVKKKQEEVNKFLKENASEYKNDGIVSKITDYFGKSKFGRMLRKGIFTSMVYGTTLFAEPKFSNLNNKAQTEQTNDDYTPEKTGEKLDKTQSTKGDITIDAFTSDDSSKVVKYVANLKDANNNIIKTAYPDSNRVTFKDVPTPVENEKNTVPTDFMLYQNYPNPFNPSTKIQFDVSKQGNVRLDVYDILGKHVKTLVNGELDAGKYEATWATDNDNGETVAQGVYIYRLIAGDKSISKKMVDLGSAKGTSSFRQLGSSELSGLEKSLSGNKVMDANYTVEIAPTDSTNPKILTKLIPLILSSDTAFSAYIDRKPVTISADVFTGNGSIPVTGYNAILKDTLDNVIDQITATGNHIAFQNEAANKFYRMQIHNTSSTNPSINDTVFQFKAISDTLFNVNASRRTRTISGLLTDDEGNVKSGYILVYNANGDSAAAMAGIDGKFSIETKSSNGDTLKAQIYNPNHAEGFIRKIYVAGGNDTSNVKVDAVPLLADSAYIAPDVLGGFAWEGNFKNQSNGMNYEGLKKAKLDSLKEIISSYYSVTGDTINADEQLYIINIIGQKIDPSFKKPSIKHVVPQDSTITSNDPYVVNWFKNKNGQPGSISSWDLNNDGLIDGSKISLSYIINITGQDTVYNDRAIVQEGLSARIAPGEVGFTSTIGTTQTVLHKNTGVKTLQPADIWLVKIAENYAPKTSYYALLTIGNLQPAYDKLKK